MLLKKMLKGSKIQSSLDLQKNHMGREKKKKDPDVVD